MSSLTVAIDDELAKRKGVLDYGYSDNKIQTGFGSVAELLKSIYVNSYCHFAYPASRISDRQRFELLTLTWQRDTQLSSISLDLTAHSAYQQIIGMGERALPYIFEKLALGQAHWYIALQAITGINPIKKEHRGNIPKMTEDWIEWGRSNGYFDF